MAPPPKPSASKATASKATSAEAKRAAGKTDTTAEVAAIAARVEQLALGQQGPAFLLSKEMKKTVVKHGNKFWPKPCGGPGVCDRMLCEHKYTLPLPRPDSALAPTTSGVDEKILALLLQKLDSDGYPVTKHYASGFLAKSKGKLVVALMAIKQDIDARKFYDSPHIFILSRLPIISTNLPATTNTFIANIHPHR